MKTTIVMKVIGVGGAGGNAVHRMMTGSFEGVELIAVNTDVQDLQKIRAGKKIQIGKQSTKGLGAGMNPDIGRKAALESRETLREMVKGSDLVFLTAGLGGGTGGGAAPVIAEIAKSQRALVVAVVTLPFSFEGAWRARFAQQALENLKNHVDTLFVIPNDQLLKIIGFKTTVLSAFFAADQILREAVKGISELVAKPSLINVDFAALKNILRNGGRAVFGIGKGKGEKRLETALQGVLFSPLLGISPKGAKGVLFSVQGARDLRLTDIQKAAEHIRKELNSSAKIIFGAGYDKELEEGELKILLFATGLKDAP